MNTVFQRLIDASGQRANLVVRLLVGLLSLDACLSRRLGPAGGTASGLDERAG
jgi:hypothetical protein